MPFTIVTIFLNATPLQKLVICGLLVATVAAVIVCVAKLSSGRRLSGGSHYLAGLRVGGPLVGTLGAIYCLLNMWIGIANVAETPPLKVLAHGFAESTFVMGLGILAGAVAVGAHWAVEARIDRAVLKT